MRFADGYLVGGFSGMRKDGWGKEWLLYWELDNRWLMQEALIAADDEDIREKAMGDKQGKMGGVFGQVEHDGAGE